MAANRIAYMLRRVYRQSGFSLVTASVVLTVAALVFVSMLPGKGVSDINQRIITNEKKLEKVEESMRSFMAVSGRRPCPADGAQATGTANFGKEAATPGTCTVTSGMMGPDATGNIVGGMIPTRALGLPDEYAFDSWGRRFTYIIDKQATLNSSCLTLSPSITIKDGTSGTTVDTTMYAFISHGKDGHGAFPAQGSTAAARLNTGSTDQDKNTNAGVSNDGSFTANWTNVRVQKSSTSTFGDMVWYRPDLKGKCCIGSQCGGGGGGGGGSAPCNTASPSGPLDASF